MTQFPKKAYGICPIGHNLSPSSDTGDSLSTELIDEGEEQPLFWSNYYQAYVCAFCLRRVEDKKHEKVAHDKYKEVDKKLSGMGFTQT